MKVTDLKWEGDGKGGYTSAVEGSWTLALTPRDGWGWAAEAVDDELGRVISLGEHFSLDEARAACKWWLSGWLEGVKYTLSVVGDVISEFGQES